MGGVVSFFFLFWVTAPSCRFGVFVYILALVIDVILQECYKQTIHDIVLHSYMYTYMYRKSPLSNQSLS